MTDRLTELRLDQIRVSRTVAQTARRKRFKTPAGKEAMNELTDSVKTHGVLQPIICRATAKDYEMVAGERRFRAAKAAGLEVIPAVVRALSDAAVIEVQLIENLQRQDVHPMEEAEGYQSLLKKHGIAMQDLNAKVGKSRTYVYGRLKLLALCEKAREAFYEEKISASLALLVARIPTEALQKEALAVILEDNWSGEPMSYREARDMIQEEYTLRLDQAPFKTADPDLVPKAGACNTCIHRTGNQPELFGDIKRADVCTHPVCYKDKAKTQGDQAIERARKRGQEVISGKAAAKIISYGNAASARLSGYMRLDERPYEDRKNRTVRKIIPKDTPITLLQDPDLGNVVKVVRRSVVDKALPKSRASASNPITAQDKKRKEERAYREELYQRVRPKLPAPGLVAIATALYNEMDFDTRSRVCKLQGFKIPTVKQKWGGTVRDSHAILKTLPGMSDEELGQFLNDCIYAGELYVGWYDDSAKPERLLAAAKSVKVRPAAARAAVKKRLAKKKAKKKKVVRRKKR